MTFIDLRTADASVRQSALRLNAEHEVATSPLDRSRLDTLLGECTLARARADGRALLLAFGPGAASQGGNYAWVSARYPRFVYIDRVIVGRELQGRGIGRALYEAVFAHARAMDVPVLCEVNLVPPNPDSDAFHHALGFDEVGRAQIGPGKTVRYLCRAAG